MFKEGNIETPQEIIDPEIEDIVSRELKFNQKLQAESKDKGPEISMKIWYSPHVLERDYWGIEGELDKADIFAPEEFGYEKETLDEYKALANGEMSPDDIEQNEAKEYGPGYKRDEARRKIFEVIFNSRKQIIFIDVPNGHPLVKRWMKALEERFFIAFRSKDINSFYELLRLVKKNLKEYADIQKERDEYILSQLKPRVDECIKADPRLRNASKIQILISLGSLHTPIYHALKKRNENVQRIFRSPAIFPFADEGARRYQFNKEIDNDLAARILLEEYLDLASDIDLIENIKDTKKSIEVLRKIIGSLDFNEIKSIFQRLHKGKNFHSVLSGALQKKGLKVPNSEKEADEMLHIRPHV